MKTALVVALFLISVSRSSAEIVFQGYATIENRSVFVLSVDKEKASGWLTIGQSFDGFSILAFDPVAEVLTVEKDGKRHAIHIADGKIQTQNEASNLAEKKPIVISIGESEKIFVGDDVAMIDALRRKFEVIAAMKPQPIVTLRAPGDASLDRLRVIMDLFKSSGITRFNISTP